MQAAVIALTALSAYSQYQAGIAQQQQYDRQALMEELKGRNDALAHREQGVAVMDNMLSQMAYSNAYAGAGGTDPFSGSKLGASEIIQSKGIREFNITKYNAEIGIEMANYQASIYRFAGKQAKRQGITNAMTTMVQGAYMYNQMTPSSAPTGGGAPYGQLPPMSRVTLDPYGQGPAQTIFPRGGW